MNKSIQIPSIALLFLLMTFGSFAQNNPWTKVNEKDIPVSGIRYIVPESYQTLKLNVPDMKKILSKAPMTGTTDVQESPLVLSLPWPDGSFKSFQIIESPIMEPELRAKFPEIKTYSGAQVDDHSRYIRLDLTPQGFHAMVLTAGEGTVYIDPYSFGKDIDHYTCYFKKDFRPVSGKSMVCGVLGNPINTDDFRPDPTLRFGTCELRSYRLAISATGEYTAFHGGTVALAQAAQVTTMNRVNGVFIRDFAVQMNIIGNNNLIIYTNAATDPFSNGNTGAMINENQTNTDNVIGSSNYDIGHIFGTNSGGLAGLGVICSNGNKARGVTGSGAPIGDPFDIDYVAHEMGHQFGANHTQNNNCNRNNATAMEPGSASTIMGYAGICAPNVQNNSDDHFHGVSMEEISNRLLATNCAVKTPLSNSAPAISGTNGNVTLPVNTPFALTCNATDPDATNVLSYCWEQMDNAAATMPPVATSTQGPNFRSNSPTTSPTRYFPNLADLAAGINPTWEVIPSVSRTMDFRVTVRDNAPGGGCTDEADIVLTFDASSGPFVVTYPNATGISWVGNSSETVTWNVANTDISPVSCANVDILLSTDGGLTFPTVLASNVPNDGSQLVTVPNTPSNTCRIMVICSNGTFFDISDNNFAITGATFDYTLTVTPTSTGVCVPNNAVYQIDIGSIGGYNDPVTLSITGVPAGGIATFGTNPVTPVGTSTLTISNTAGITPGSYSMTLSANSTSGLKQQILTLDVSDPTSPVTLTSPLNGATAVPVPTTFNWSAAPGGSVTYDIDIASDAAFTTIVDNATGLTNNTFTSSALSNNTTYYWRVRALNACGTAPFSTTFSFTTNNCTTYSSTNVPVTISPNGTPTITSTLNVPISGTISDINVVNLTGTHTWINDLTVTLTSPTANSTILWGGICNNEDNFDVNFDDAAAPGNLPCPPVGGGTYQPQGALSVHNGSDPLGNWTLTIADGADQDGGQLLTWGLEICAATDYTLAMVNNTDTVCTTDDATYNIDIGQSGTYTDPVTLSVSGLPGASTASFSTNPVTPVGSSTLTISNLGAVAAGTYNLDLNSNSTSGPKIEAFTLVVEAAPTAVTLNNPADLSTGINPAVTFDWTNAGTGVTYEIEISTDAAFSSIIESATGLTSNTYTATGLSSSTTYYWHVLATNDCGSSSFSVPFSFITSNCMTLMSTDIPIGINNNATATSTLNFPGTGVISDINVIDVTGAHGRVGQLTVDLISPSATSVTLWSNICGNDNDFDLNFDDAAAPGAIPCPPTTAGTYQPQTALSAFNGENANGIWTLSVTDNAAPTTGTLQSWGLEVCMAGCNLAASSSSNQSSCNGSSDGSATVTVVSGTAPYTYLWDVSAGGQNAQTATGLSAGSYTVTITDADACEIPVVVIVGEPTALSLSLSNSSDASCNGLSDGTASINVSGGTAAYLYNIGSGNQANNTFNGLSAGSYNCTVTDNNGCSDVLVFSINEPAVLNLSVSSTSDPSCNNGSNGSVNFNASGGTAAYQYDIGNGNQVSASFSGLSAGSYTCTITDANSCTSTQSFSLNNPAAINANAVVNNAITCAGGNNADASANASGGAGGFNYNWSNGQNNANATGLGAGNYTVTATDINGCSGIASITLTDPNGINASLNISSNYNGASISCNGASDGSATSTVSGGSVPYSYNWSNGQSTANANGLSAGNYTLTVTDATGCTTISSINLTQPNVISTSVLSLDALCNGESSGQVVSSIFGGTGAYSYSWSNGNTGFSALNLSAGNYSVTFSDANGCTATESAVVGEPTVLNATFSGSSDALCFGSSDGSISFSASGGTTAYSYDIGNGSQTSGTFNGLSAATYTVTVTDANNCTTTQSGSINNPIQTTASTSLLTGISCAGGNDASANVSASGGTGSYTYIWSNGQVGNTASGLSAGSYTATATDGNGCIAQATITVNNPPGMNLTTAVVSDFNGQDVSCNGSSDGEATVNVSGGTPGYSYIWENGQNTQNATGLSFGNYNVTVTDASGCTTISSVNIFQPASLNISTTANDVACNGENSGSATANGSGGTAPYTYLWDNNATSSNISGLTAGNYLVTIYDANGCEQNSSTTVNEPLTLQSSVIDNGDGSATVSTTGGTAPYTYLWDNNASGQTGATASGLMNNTYYVTITDANACTTVDSINIVISKTDNIDNGLAFDLYPNPNNGSFNINLDFGSIEKFNINITNVLGQTLIEKSFETDKIQIPIRISQQASGVYFVNIHANDRVYTKKFVLIDQ